MEAQRFRSLSPGAGFSLAARVTASKPRLYAIVILCSLLAALAYKLRTESIFACPASGYGPARYLAYCQTKGYGDYDHGAMWYRLQPAAVEAVESAEAVFIGNSRMQFALSSDATANWFGSNGRRFYLLGFSYGENVLFLKPLLDRMKLKASVYIINVDQFFYDDYETGPTRAIRLQPDESRAGYEEKRRWQSVHRVVCGSLPGLCGNGVAFFRSEADGLWELRGAENFKPARVAVPPEAPLDVGTADGWKRRAALGNAFVSRLPVDRRCVFLTLAPSSLTSPSQARVIADDLKLDLIIPRVDGLATFDGDHLDRPSAERWSSAFFDAAGSRLRDCLGKGGPHAPVQ